MKKRSEDFEERKFYTDDSKMILNFFNKVSKGPRVKLEASGSRKWDDL